MVFTFGNTNDVDWPFENLRHPPDVSIFAGPAKSLGGEKGVGFLTLLPGSIKVFKGP